ncbi:uncharacterized protein LOC120553807 isoform X2 [Perca fluviatilis]|uniref:uncharacterized protein LOC120553807 isoform X2 n=1 Tax=Perca fluviatilis TaxID=8168 RepID=UPI001964A772|nr:uncharacterized protein LOC120553807 isoform X2 [Perca fluviatilis]
MARCRSYLRGLAICVTVLLLVSGVVMIGVGFSSVKDNILVAQLSSSDGLLVLQVFGPITVVLSVLGICAASLDLKPLLLVMGGAVDEVFLNVTPLHRAESYIQTELNKLQASDSCCGLRSFEDWENQLPVTCFCTPPASNLQPSSQSANSSSEGRCVMVGPDFYPPNQQLTEKLWVHSEPCGPILKSYLSFPIKLRIGIISAFATITMAAIALCLTLGLEEYWKTPPVETTVDDFNRVKYKPKPSLT